MAETKDLALLLDDAEVTAQKIVRQIVAARAASEVGEAPVIGSAARKIVTQQLINQALRDTSSLVDELTIVTTVHCGDSNV